MNESLKNHASWLRGFERFCSKTSNCLTNRDSWFNKSITRQHIQQIMKVTNKMCYNFSDNGVFVQFVVTPAIMQRCDRRHRSPYSPNFWTWRHLRGPNVVEQFLSSFILHTETHGDALRNQWHDHRWWFRQRLNAPTPPQHTHKYIRFIWCNPEMYGN